MNAILDFSGVDRCLRSFFRWGGCAGPILLPAFTAQIPSVLAVLLTLLACLPCFYYFIDLSSKVAHN